MSALYKYTLMLLTGWQQTESNFNACALANFNVIICTAININNYKSHQMCIQIQSIAFMLSLQEMQAGDIFYSVIWVGLLSVHGGHKCNTRHCFCNSIKKLLFSQLAKNVKPQKHNKKNSCWTKHGNICHYMLFNISTKWYNV